MTVLTRVTSTVTRVPSSATVVTLLDATALRAGFKLFNESTAVLYVKEGAGASITDYSFQVAPGALYSPVGVTTYIGIITGLWAAANGAAQVTESA